MSAEVVPVLSTGIGSWPGADVEDAVMAAGRLLRANGAPRDLSGALFAYNQSDSYVDAVQTYAANMRRAPQAYRGYWHWRVLYRHTRGTLEVSIGLEATTLPLAS